MPSNELYHYGVLGMRWGVRRYQNEDGTLTTAGKRRKKSVNASEYAAAVKKKRKAKRDYEHDLAGLQLENIRGYQTDSMIRGGIAGAGIALGTAAVGSVATHQLAKRGKDAAATWIYTNSRKAFNVMAASAAANLGSAYLSSMFGGGTAAKEYREDKKALRKKYQEAVNDSWAGKTTRHPATKTDGAGTNGSTRDRLNTVGKTDGWGTGTSAAEERLKKYRRY